MGPYASFDCKEEDRGEDYAAKGTYISKVQAIVSEAHEQLDFSMAPELCERLEQLYLYMMERLTEANLELTTEPLDEAVNLLKTLREGWNEALTSLPQDPTTNRKPTGGSRASIQRPAERRNWRVSILSSDRIAQVEGIAELCRVLLHEIRSGHLADFRVLGSDLMLCSVKCRAWIPHRWKIRSKSNTDEPFVIWNASDFSSLERLNSIGKRYPETFFIWQRVARLEEYRKSLEDPHRGTKRAKASLSLLR